MTSAYRAVLEDHMSVKRAAITYGVPQTTLRQRVLGRVDPETTSSGPSPELNQEEEAVFVEHIKSMARLGYGYTTNEVVSMASNYATFLTKRDEEHPFSRKWFRGFMKRWPDLIVTKPRSLANYRAKAASQTNISEYFKRLHLVLTKLDLLDKPQCIYNVDEKGTQTEHSPPYIVSACKSTPAVTSSRSAITTILGCGNALGTMMPPFYIFKGKRFSNELLKGSSAGSQGMVTDSGWSNAKAFQVFLRDHFIRYLQRGGNDQTVLLIFDGHKSHINVPVIDWAQQHNIELFVLPAHTSHILQPLDVGCFGPLQRIYNTECHKFIRCNPNSNITRYNVAELSSKAYDLALSSLNLKSAFQRTGIYPFNPAAIDPEKLEPASAFEQPKSIPSDAGCEAPHDESSFFSKQWDLISLKQNKEKVVKNTISKEASGACITEPNTVQKIKDHQTSKKVVQKRKKSDTKFSKSTNEITIPEKKAYKISEPLPGPSAIQVCEDSDSESYDESIAEEEKCCQCKKFQPEQLRNCISLVFTSWAQCDIPSCKHWTHLIYCCKERVVRRHDRFVCPCHSEE